MGVGHFNMVLERKNERFGYPSRTGDSIYNCQCSN